MLANLFGRDDESIDSQKQRPLEKQVPEHRRREAELDDLRKLYGLSPPAKKQKTLMTVSIDDDSIDLCSSQEQAGGPSSSSAARLSVPAAHLG